MTSSRHFEGDIMFSTGYGSLFSDKTYTTVVFMSFRMSAFIFGVCFSTFIYFSFVFNNKFQHVQMLHFYPCCHASFDRLYTSIPLAKWLLEKRITCIGTMQLNRKGIPDELKETKNRELLSSEIYWDENSPLSISSHVVKASKGKTNVILLSTAPPVF